MKKLSLFAKAFLVLSIAANAQTPFFDKVDFVGAMGATDWTTKWTNFRPDTINYGAVTTEVNSPVGVATDITTNTTWTADKVYHLSNFVYVKNGATLTIQPGTVIRATKDGVTSAGALVITRGSKIMAEGTADMPIVFTSDKPVGQRALGDWGGVMLFGNAKQNQPKLMPGKGSMPADYRETNFEVFPTSNLDIWYGGKDDADNSGTLKYVRIEFAGWYQVVNSEINALTFGAVGSGTTIDYVQTSYTNDDSYEFFGGAVNCKHMIAYAGVDDEFDTDCGYRGMIQYAIGLRHPLYWDASSGGASNGFESDNNTGGTTVVGEPNPFPITAPIFSNVTLVGPVYPGKTSSMLRPKQQFQNGMRIRTNSSLSVFNSIELGYPSSGLNLNHWNSAVTPSVYSKALADSISIQHVYYGGHSIGKVVTNPANVPAGVVFPDGNSKFDAKQWLMQASFSNDTSTTNSTDFNLTYPQVDTVGAPNPFQTPSVMPKVGSKVLTGASFDHAKLKSNLVTGINDVTETNISVSAYPNPFSGSTTIAARVATPCNVNITVMDLKGNVVAELANGFVSSDITVEFDATNLAKGIYVAKVITGTTVKTTKLLVK